jgi:hypothetical protein
MLVTARGVVSLFIIRIGVVFARVVLEGVLWNWLIVGARKRREC